MERFSLSVITEYYDPLYSHNLKNKNNKVINKYHLQSLTNRSINDFCEVIKKDLGVFKISYIVILINL